MNRQEEIYWRGCKTIRISILAAVAGFPLRRILRVPCVVAVEDVQAVEGGVAAVALRIGLLALGAVGAQSLRCCHWLRLSRL